MTKHNSIVLYLKASLYNLPTPASLSYFWNFGSILGLLLSIQILTGLFLVFHYSADVNFAFDSLSHISRDVHLGWLIRYIHATGASFFFLCIYVHIGRGIYFGGYLNFSLWVIGLVILFLLIAISFLGYILPWGQISFWGATVITNLLSALPYFGTDLVHWIWGGFSVSDATLKRFLAFHFLFPFLMVACVAVHLLFLHETGSSTPLGLNNSYDLVPFHNLYTYNDIFGFLILFWVLSFSVCFFPKFLMEPDNYIPANPISTPPHIIPEWYFLFAYAILRSVSSKLGGVLVIFSSLLILLSLYFTHFSNIKTLTYYGPVKFLFWSFISSFALLTWLGACPVTAPFSSLSQLFTFCYFLFFLLLPLLRSLWDAILFLS